ncbi:MAG: hypothetical protein Q4A01_10245 [Coriobacteriales bacterium]|nr:hypothetical protein [Coriobacteriales bacterium]
MTIEKQEQLNEAMEDGRELTDEMLEGANGGMVHRGYVRRRKLKPQPKPEPESTLGGATE